MVSGRASAIEHTIRLSLRERTITVSDVMDGLDTSRRTVRRALKDAEELGWVEKPAPNADRWVPSDKARENRIAERTTGYQQDTPQMYYVTGNTTAPDCLFDENVLVSAGVGWRNSGSGFSIGIPDARTLMVDSGGYQAAVYFRDEYPYGPADLHRWAENIRADVVWGMDWACEDREVLASLNDNISPDDIAPYEDRLLWAWEDQIDQFEEHQQGRYGHEFRPVVQGQQPAEYREFARRLRESHLPTENVGIGTVCKRETRDGILRVLNAVRDELPETNIHLFGATLEVWKDQRFAGLFDSSDTAAWETNYQGGEGDGCKIASGQAELSRAFEDYRDKVENARERLEYHKSQTGIADYA